MSKPAAPATPRATTSEEHYYGGRLRAVASIGAQAGRFSLGGLLARFKTEEPCSRLVLLHAPLETTLATPEALLPLFHAFRHPYALEIFLTSDGQIQFQIALHDDDAGVLAHLRTLYGSHLTTEEQSVEAWNAASGLGAGNSLAYLLPESSLYPMNFALAWKDADVVALVLEQLKTLHSGPLLVQLLVVPEPDAGRGLATDVLAAASHLGGRVEAFRLGLIRERFNSPLARFALRLLAPTDGALKPLINSLCVLAAPFNRLRAVTLSRTQTREVSESGHALLCPGGAVWFRPRRRARITVAGCQAGLACELAG